MAKPKTKQNQKKLTPGKRTLAVEQGPAESIEFTFFAACGNYPKQGYEYLPSVWWSGNFIGRQLWKEIERDESFYGQLGPIYKGRIPLEVLLFGDGKNFDGINELMFDGLDFTKVYKNWVYKYQIGNARYVNGRYEERPVKRTLKSGEEVVYTQKEYKADLLTNVYKTVEKSKGNPPTQSFTKEERKAYREANYGE